MPIGLRAVPHAPIARRLLRGVAATLLGSAMLVAASGSPVPSPWTSEDANRRATVKQKSDLAPLQGVFEIYATGYRNGYDLVWHSNGRLYLNGNAANLSQGNTPGSTDGCSTPSTDPGNQPDTLNLVNRGAYGGHPDPDRGECVWGDGTIYNPRFSRF